MRPAWAILGGLLLGIAAWWWTRAGDADAPPRPAGNAPAATGEALPGLYRWRDEQGRLQITEQPPPGREYERIDRQHGRAIEVRGER